MKKIISLGCAALLLEPLAAEPRSTAPGQSGFDDALATSTTTLAAEPGHIAIRQWTRCCGLRSGYAGTGRVSYDREIGTRKDGNGSRFPAGTLSFPLVA